MKIRRKVIIALVAVSLLPALSVLSTVDGAGRKKGALSISFHVEGDKAEGERRVAEDVVNGKTVYFRRMPVVSNKQFKGYWPFPADDGTWGAAFRLSTSGQRRLNTAGLVEKGRLMRVVVNMRMVDVQVIDEAPRDGMIIVWKGLTEAELAQIGKEMPQLAEQ